MIKLGDKMLENSKKMLQDAKQHHYAIPHFNINNLEWTKYILEECEKEKIPVILGVSEGAIKYMGGYHTVVSLVKGLMKDLMIDIPVCLHLDHGKSVESCKNAIDAGFTSVMIDASKYPLEENIEKTKEVVRYAHEKGVSVEAEIGHIGGSEDDVTQDVFHAKLEECNELFEKTKIDSLAPALGSVHGFYKGEPNLNFLVMKQLDEQLPIPLVLHGGTGIPKDQIQKAISCGINKININTELQAVWNKAVRTFIDQEKDVYDPRKIIGSGEAAVKEKIAELIETMETRQVETK